MHPRSGHAYGGATVKTNRDRPTVRPTMSEPWLRTHSRERLPKTLSYPLKAQEVAEGLLELAGRELRLIFHRRRATTTAQSAVVRDSAPIAAAAGSFRNWSAWKNPASRSRDHGHLQEEWTLLIYGVPRQHKGVVRKALLERGLPLLHEWFSRSRSDDWLLSPPSEGARWEKSMTVHVDPTTGAVSVTEIG